MAGKLPNLKFKNVVSDDSSDDDDVKDSRSHDLSLSLEKLDLGPRKKLLVLSPGGLLVHRVHIRDRFTVKGYKPDVVYGKFLVFKRPFCSEFLKFCLERFEVGLWSSAREHNIDGVLSSIMVGLRGKLAFIWDQSDCTDSGFDCLENSDKPIFLKDLNKLWENKYKNLPWRSGEYSSANTLMIDDEPYKALLNPPNTAIFPKKFEVGSGNDVFLGPKGELQEFLDGLADAKDVPSYVKEHPFGQPAITTSHPDWGFYSKIVKKFNKGKESCLKESIK